MFESYEDPHSHENFPPLGNLPLHENDHPAIEVQFALNEITLLVEHDSDVDTDFLRAWFEAVFPSFEPRVGLLDVEMPIVPFTIPEYENAEPSNIPRSGSLIYLQIRDEFEERHDADQFLTDVLYELNERIGGDGFIPVFDGPPIRIRAGAPNWLFGGAPHQIIDGGPGGAPVKDASVGGVLKYTMSTPPAQVAIAHMEGECEPPPVDVVILDTAPPPAAYSHAVATFGNPLLQSVSRNLDIKYVRDLGAIPLPLGANQSANYVSHRGNYEISDHGLFIAGIVHSSAPNARLHLFEVLNSHGTGTVATLMQGVTAIKSLLPNAQRVIVNCSLCISFQNALALTEHFNWQLPSFVGSFQTYLDDLLLLPLKTVIQLALHYSPNVEVAIVAAAGNDGKAGVNPPAARLPAALPSVIGVGATDSHGGLAEYSNLADQPPLDGWLTYGGLTQPAAAGQETLTDNQTGILGLYIGRFPDGTLSTDGWARWSGTSFATAVLSGVLAQAALSCFHIDARPGSYLEVLKDSGLPTNNAGATILEALQV